MSEVITCSFGSPDSVCRLEGTGSQIKPLLACKYDVTSHLVNLGLSHQNISEVDLILNRAGFFVATDEEKLSMTICPRHRKKMTTDWPGRKSFTCSYPTHRGPKKSINKVRRINAALSAEIYQLHHSVVPIGSAVCSSCRGNHYKTRTNIAGEQHLEMQTLPQKDSHTISEDSTMVVTENTSTCEDLQTLSSQSQSSQSSIPEGEVSIWLDEMEDQNSKRQKLNESVNSISEGRYSPLMSTLNTVWDDVSDTQQRYYIRKAKETIATTLSVITPGQEEVVWKALQTEALFEADRENQGKRKRFDPHSGIVDVLIKTYEQASHWRTKRQILSLFADDFSRAELQEMIPGLSKWRIDQARQHATEAGRGNPVPEIPHFRMRIDREKVDHFIDYISRPEFSQDMAFGTKTLKLDSGEKIIIPAVIRTVIPSRIISQYLEYCKEQEFEPVSKSSLYRIIEVCSASMQKSLQGLDNTTADGSEAFDDLLSMWGKLAGYGINVTTIQKQLKNGKRYLKTDFKTHVGRGEQCSDHCSVHALSDDKAKEFKKDCEHQHIYECDRCEELESVLVEVLEAIRSADMEECEKARLNFEYNECVQSVKAWKAHLLRSSNQDEAKQYTLQNLNKESCFIIMDWAMKFLPVRYREQMSDFFGKRGKSWHISAVITAAAAKHSKYEVECFVHILNNCTQNSFAVLSIIEDLLHKVKQEYPAVTQAYLRSDNAGCYHNGPLLLSLREVGERTGVTPVRYDFSDPQSGKDICDRKAASMKAHIKRWVNEKHNVLTAEDMKAALESHGGIRGCRAAVVEVEPSRERNNDNKIPGISVLNNFQYEKIGIRVWKAYDIGPGRLIPYSNLSIVPQGETGLKVLQPFGSATTQRGKVGESVRSRSEIYACQETGCVLTFKTQTEADKHMDTGKHRLEVDCESMYDRIRKKWAGIVAGVTIAAGVPSTSAQGKEMMTDIQAVTRPSGWALKVTRKSSRMTEKVKAFLKKKFEEGARTGNKADPAQLAREMKILTNEDGQFTFTPEEWRSSKQISSLFSRLKAAQGLRGINAEEIPKEDIEAAETEEALDTMIGLVMDDMSRPSHPIVVGSSNICDLVRTSKLVSLKLAVLKDVCEQLKLTISGPLSRKKTFCVAIEVYAKSCTCCKD